MNHIYKTKYNEALRTWVAVPEIAKGRGKNSANVNRAKSPTLSIWQAKRKSLVVALSAIFALLGVNQTALSATLASNSNQGKFISIYPQADGGGTEEANASAKGGVAIGVGATVTKESGIALGTYAKTVGTGAIAIGNDYDGNTATKAGRDTTAIGWNIDAAGSYQGLALGSLTKLRGKNNIVLGSGERSGNTNTVANIFGNDNTVIGSGNQVNTGATVEDSCTGDNCKVSGADKNIILGSKNTLKSGVATNLVLGSNNTIEDNINSSYVFGSNVTVKASNSVYIGDASTAELNNVAYTAGELGQTSQVIAGKTYNFAGKGKTGGGVITVGGLDPTTNTVTGRIIQNVAPGKISDKSTDAINGSQLYSVVDMLNTDFIQKRDTPVVYTDDQGQQVVKGADGKWYHPGDIDEATGNGPAGTDVADNTVQVRVKNADGSATKAMPIRNVGTALTGGVSDTVPADNTFTKNLRGLSGNDLNVAATAGDLQNLANTPLFFAGDTGTGNTELLAKKPGETLSIESGKFNFEKVAGVPILAGYAAGNSNAFNGDNLAVVKKDGKLLIGLKDEPEFRKLTVTDGTNTTTIDPNQISTKKVTGLDNLTNSSDGSDAANKNYVDKVKNNTFKLTGDGGSETGTQQLDKSGGLSFAITGDTDITTKASGDGVVLSLNKSTSVTSGDDQVVTGDAVSKAIDAAKIHYYSVNAGAASSLGANLDNNKSNQGAIGQYALAAGVGAQAQGESSIAVGKDAAIRAFKTTPAAKSIAIGSGANVTPNDAIWSYKKDGTPDYDQGYSAVAIGTLATATGDRAIALGRETEAGLSGIAIGAWAKTSGSGAIAIGTDYQAGEHRTLAAQDAISLGYWTQAGQNSVVLGTRYKDVGSNNLILGAGNSGASQSTITGTKNVVLGNYNKITSGNNITILGSNIEGKVGNATYIGDYSVATTDGTKDATAGNTKYDTSDALGLNWGTFAGQGQEDSSGNGITKIVTFGNVNSERRLQNVAAGKISVTSTDAINGSQLYSLADAADKAFARKDDLPIAYTNKDGDKLVKVGDKYYKAADVKNGVPKTGAPEEIPEGTTLVDANGNNAPQKLNNVAGIFTDNIIPQTASNEPDVSAINNALTKAQAASPGQAANLTDLKAVSDIANHGWYVKVSDNGGTSNTNQTGKGYNVTPTNDQLELVAGTNISLDQKGSKITIATNDQAIVNNTQMPVAYTKADGTKVYLVKDPTTGKMVFNDKKDGTGKTVSADQVVASMQSPDGSTKKPTKLANIGSVIKGDVGNGAPVSTKPVLNGQNGSNTFITNLGNLTDKQKASAATAGDLQKLSQTPLFFSGDNEKNTFARKLSEEVKIVGGASGKLTDNNIGVESNGTDTLTVKLAKNLTGLETAEFKDSKNTTGPSTKITPDGIVIKDSPTDLNPVMLTQDGLDNGGNKITNVKDGTVASGSKDAINGGQLNDSVGSVADLLGGGVKNTNGKLTNGFTVGSTTYNTVAEAINAANTSANAGWNVTDAKGNSANIGPKGQVSFESPDNNLSVVQKGTKDKGIVEFTLSKDLKLDSVTTGDSKLDDNGLSIKGGPSVTKTGIDAAGKKITNVEKGDVSLGSTDAINGSQLYNQGVSVKKIIGGNTSYDPTTGEYTNTDIGGTGKSNINDAIESINATAGTAAKGWNLAASANAGGEVVNNVATDQVKPTETVTFDAGKNIAITHNDNEISIATKDEVEFAKVTADDGAGNSAVLTKSGTTVEDSAGNKSTYGAAGSTVKDTAGNQTVYNAGGVTITPTGGAAPVSLTSGGLNNGGNKITNIAAGTAPTDAVNVSQLSGVAGSLGAQIANVSTHVTQVDNHVTNINGAVGGGGYLSATGTLTAKGREAIKTYNVEGNHTYENRSVIEAIKNINEQGIRFFHTNDGQRVIEDGVAPEDSSAAGIFSVAIGYQASVGHNGDNSVAIGKGARVSGKNSIAIGTGHVVNGNNAGAFGDPNVVNGNNSYAIGNNNVINADNTFVLGNEVQADAGHDGAVVLGDKSTVDKVHQGPLSWDGHAVAGKRGAGTRVVSVGSKGNERQIQNVAPGVISATSTDAVNGSQLHTIANEIDQRASAGIASAMATAGLPQAYLPGKSMVSAAAGHYRGENAIAVGVSTISDNGKWIIKGTANANGDDFGVTVGAGYQW